MSSRVPRCGPLLPTTVALGSPNITLEEVEHEIPVMKDYNINIYVVKCGAMDY